MHGGITADSLASAGLGLRYGHLALSRVTSEWVALGSDLAEVVGLALGRTAARVEHVGSTAIEGMTAKPIIDLAVGTPAQTVGVDAVAEALAPFEWHYSGDAASDGGHIFVLESEPAFRVAHLHVVPYEGLQWRRYLQLRELLRRDASARASYGELKAELAQNLAGDHIRRRYTEQKSPIIRELLGIEPGPRSGSQHE